MKGVLDRMLPKYTKRRLAASLLATACRQPARLRHRLNAHNVFLYKQFTKVNAHCCICGACGPLFYGMPDLKLRRDHSIGVWREALLCQTCGSTQRQRTLTYVLLSVLRERFGFAAATMAALAGELQQVSIWDTDAFSPLSAIIRARPGCILSKYLPDRPFGVELEPGLFNIDLQRISFESNRFDVILSSDIMEHVPDDRAAHAEILRCLKPGGAYIFTVPYVEEWARTRHLVVPGDSGDIFLTEPHYHGDPLTGGILAYRIYGRELIVDLEALGYQVQFLWLNRADEGIFDGDCFVATKVRA